MIVPDDSYILQTICRASGKWGIMAMITIPEHVSALHWRAEIMKATKDLIDIHTDQHAYVAQAVGFAFPGTATVYFLFDTEEAQHDAFFNRIYGDDNSDVHGYSGPLHTIRCLTCTPDGTLEHENS